MPDASIVVKMTDRYSETARKMAQVTRHFSKDAEQLEDQLHQLDKNKYTLKMDLSRAKSQLKEAERQFDLTRSAADGLKVELAHANYDGITRNLKTVTRAARDTEREISKLYTRGAGAAPSSSGGSMGQKLAGAIGAVGVGQLAGNLLTSGGSALAGSLLGSREGGIISNALGSAATGAAAGFAFGGPVGALAGGLAGAAGGALSGGIQAFEDKDNAFKGFVRERIGEQEAKNKTMLSIGAPMAAKREVDKMTFSTLFGSKSAAEGYMKEMVAMADRTPFQEGDLVEMSKTLATFGYGLESIIPVLTKVGDAGAALGHSVQDMNTIATVLGRMKMTNKGSLEYLNMLTDRKINAVGILSSHYGISQQAMLDRISRGELSGSEATDIILDALGEQFGGSMLTFSTSGAGLSSTVEGLQGSLAAAEGEGYEGIRNIGRQATINSLSGERGELMRSAHKIIGSDKAHLENLEESFIVRAEDEVLQSKEFQEAMARNDGHAIEAMLTEARISGTNKFHETDDYKRYQDAQLSMIKAVQEDSAVNSAYFEAGESFELALERGMMSTAKQNRPELLSPDWMTGYGDTYREAVGLPPLKADGTAPVIAAGSSSTSVTVSGNTFTVREEADIPKIAAAIAQRLAAAEGG